jgi:tRNA (guanine-N7-)-methyltransferase
MAEHGSIRSFVLRQGHMSNAQRRAYDSLMPKYGIPVTGDVLDLDDLFRRRAPRLLEIGSGMGETTALIAQAHPQYDYLAVEVHTPGVGSLLRQIDGLGLTNIRIIQHDAVEVLQKSLLPGSLNGVHIFFPDPWPKARHHKRRLIQSEFARLLSTRVESGGYIHAATDWEDYAVQMLRVFSEEPQLANSAAGYAPRPAHRPMTKFEQRGLRLGHEVWDLVFRKR